MPAATMAWAAPAALGALGLLQQGQAQKKANSLMSKGTELNNMATAQQLERSGKLGGWADSYNPVAEDAKAIATAKDAASGSIEAALRNTVSEFARGGGAPGMSSEFGVRTTGAAQRAADPLRLWAAERVGSEADRKGRALAMAAGSAPAGNLGDSFYKAASMIPQESPVGSYGAILQALKGIFSKQKGAGGSGDNLAHINDFNNRLDNNGLVGI